MVYVFFFFSTRVVSSIISTYSAISPYLSMQQSQPCTQSHSFSCGCFRFPLHLHPSCPLLRSHQSALNFLWLISICATVQTAALKLTNKNEGQTPCSTLRREKLIQGAGECLGEKKMEVSGSSVAAAKCSQGQTGIVKVKLQPWLPRGSILLFCQVQHLQYWSFFIRLNGSENKGSAAFVCCSVCIIIRMWSVVKEVLTVINCSIDFTGSSTI